MNIKNLSVFLLSLLCGCTSSDPVPEIDLAKDAYRTWHSFLGDKEASQYSSLDQITTKNVHQLEVAWTFSTGDLIEGERTEIQANPLIIDGILYGSSPLKKAFALKADTGELIWMFDPFKGEEPRSRGVNRGFSTWSDGEGNRSLFYVAGPRLWALDAGTGKPVPEFGENGSIDFSVGLDRDAMEIQVTATSPGIVYKDLLIHGSRVYNLAPGHIRAFNVRTGKIEWIFRTIPYPEGYPAVKPPWGTLNAIDLNTGEHVWNIPLGEFEELTRRGVPQTGTENYGGPVVTAGGLLFIGATQDEKFRAFDKRTGDLLWETRLPAGGYATPSVYEVDGRQFVVIAAGGGKMGTKPGDTYVAFSLPVVH
ncbi:MAG: PQQ-binding-like beta-propeller repeat protein [Balneolaceae bacterium]